MQHTVLTLLLTLGGGYLLILGLAFAFQSYLLFQPASTLVTTPDRIGLSYETVEIPTADGETLHGWWIPADGAARGTLLFFHGNAGNISGRLESARQFHSLGLNVLLVDYRGYGRSTGSPSEPGLYADAEAVWTHATDIRGLAPSSLVVFGRSMGGAPAAWLAARTSPAAVILESTFTSLPDVAAYHYPFLPARHLARMSFDTESRIADVSAPLLLIHARGDGIVPFSHGQTLYDAATEPKWFLELRGGHNDGFLISEPTYLRRIDAFLTEAGLAKSADEVR